MDKPMHVFLADDDIDDRVLLYEAIRLTVPDALLTAAGNGLELMELLTETITSLPRIIFLDLNMPISNGHECLQNIRSHHDFKTVPVIVYSTSDRQEDIDSTFNSGADFYIHKPSSFSDLQNLVKAVFSLGRFIHTKPARADFVLKSF